MILYFSGTGNSKYVAKMIAEQLQDEAVDSFDYIRNQIAGDFISGKPWIFVAPVYVSAPPIAFQQFIETGNFSGNKDAYFVMTCAGAMSASPVFCRKLCEKKGLNYKGTAQVVMPQNYIPFFKMHDKAECERRYEMAKQVVSALSDDVRNNRSFPKVTVKKAEYFATKCAVKLYYRFFMGTKQFYVTKDCVGCGLCEKVCPMGNIFMADKKPQWNTSCTHCMACINRCPKQAIEYGKKTIGKQRYQCSEYKNQNS